MVKIGKYDYKLSTKKDKKLMTEVNGKTIHFGAIVNGKPMEQFKDSTGLGLYSKYDHNDKERQKRYLARSKGIKTKDGKLTWNDKESANYYSVKFLW